MERRHLSPFPPGPALPRIAGTAEDLDITEPDHLPGTTSGPGRGTVVRGEVSGGPTGCAERLEGAPYAVDLTLDQTAEGIRATSIKVTAEPGSPPLTGTRLRGMKVWDLTRVAILACVEKGSQQVVDGVLQTHSTGPAELTPDRLRLLRAEGPTDEALEWVAHFYNIAGILGLPPTKQVETNLGIPHPTAANWVRRAKDKGLI